MNKGILYGLGAYLIWGFIPIYFKLVHNVPPIQLLGHRIVWSFLFLAIILTLRSEWKGLRTALRQRNRLWIIGVAALLLSVNWLVYIYGVISGFIVETSLGYFINPLVSVLLGVVFLRERLRPWQWLPVGMATAGVLYLTASYGRLPWIALVLAFSFGLYGLAKKKAPLGSLYGLTLETGMLFLPALVLLVATALNGSGAMAHQGTQTDILLLFSGVITSIPLLMFGAAARRIDLSVLGLLQYVAPTIQFMLGVFVYDEPFSLELLVGFSIIWAALAIFWLEGLVENRRRSNRKASEAAAHDLSKSLAR